MELVCLFPDSTLSTIVDEVNICLLFFVFNRIRRNFRVSKYLHWEILSFLKLLVIFFAGNSLSFELGPLQIESILNLISRLSFDIILLKHDIDWVHAF